jgi:uncharacterized protein YraI
MFPLKAPSCSAVFMIRQSRSLLIALTLAAVATAARAEPMPYVAYVVDDGAEVRSGPGQEYYPTTRLPQGYAVEVYRHDGDGWCAVRPPEGSFCLPTRFVLSATAWPRSFCHGRLFALAAT